MAITLVGTFETDKLTSESGNLVMTLPSHQADDFAVIFAHENDTGTDPDLSIAVATGWTEHRTDNAIPGSDRQTSVFYKKLTSGSETNPEVASTIEGDRLAILGVFRGVDTATPFDATELFDDSEGGGSSVESPTNPAITTNTDQAWVLLMASASQANGLTIGAPTGYSVIGIIDAADGAANDSRGGFVYKEVSPQGTETPGAWNNSGATSTPDWSEYTYALKPSTAGGTVNTKTLTDVMSVVDGSPIQ